MGQITFLVYSDQEECGQELARMVDQTAHGSVLEVVHDEERIALAIQELSPDALLVDLGRAPHLLLDQLAGLPRRPELFVTGPQDDSEVVLRALRLGVREFFPAAIEKVELETAIERLALAGREHGRAKKHAPVLAVMGAKGGVGATAVACQLAASLQRLGSQTAIVDLNTPLGDVALELDAQPTYTLGSVVGRKEALDSTFLHTVLATHTSGLRVLAAPERVEESELVTGDHVESVIGLLREEYDWVVVDVSRSCNEASVRALDLATQILLVTSLDVASLNHARKYVDLLHRLGHSDERIRIVANRRSANDGVSDKDFESFVGQGYAHALPNDYPTAVEAANSGKSVADVAPRSALHLSLDRLAREAHEWCGVEAVADESDGKLAALRRLFRR